MSDLDGFGALLFLLVWFAVLGMVFALLRRLAAMGKARKREAEEEFELRLRRAQMDRTEYERRRRNLAG